MISVSIRCFVVPTVNIQMRRQAREVVPVVRAVQVYATLCTGFVYFVSAHSGKI